MSDYTRERWEYIRSLKVTPRMFHNYGTLRYPKKIHTPLGIITEDTKHFGRHETSIPRVRT